MDTRESGPVARTFHFLIHGLHHKVPTDPYRLVFPPFPAVIIATTLYQPLSLVLSYPRLVLAGTICGKKAILFRILIRASEINCPGYKVAFHKPINRSATYYPRGGDVIRHPSHRTTIRLAVDSGSPKVFGEA